MRYFDQKDTPDEQSLRLTWWVGLLLVTITALLLLMSNWPTIHSSTLEVGDFAANSLLIQDAKSLGLLVGNYSRVGFNHPGPAILYVLAAGEGLFYDILHISPSPIGGQLIAVAIYNACWLIAIFTILTRITNSRINGMAATAVFACASGLADYQFFTGMWFPHLYFFPFATFLLAASRLANSRSDSWLAAAISSGFLINGHVAFVAIVGFILLTVIFLTYIPSLRYPKESAILSKAFIAAHGKKMAGFFGVLVLFFMPLIIDTALHFPGPVADYMKFSGGHKFHSALSALGFTGYYWGGILPMCTGLLLLGGIFVSQRALKDEFSSGSRALIAVLLSATMALWLYARYGVDYLDQKYTGIFYYAVPALTVALAAIYLLRKIDTPYRAASLSLLIVLLIIGTYKEIKRPVGYAPNYNQPQVAEFYHLLSHIKHSGRLVLDLRAGQSWGDVWSNVAGLLAYAKRRHDDFACVNQNWQILFTRASRCATDEIFGGRHLLVQDSADDGKMSGVPLVEWGHLSIYDAGLPEAVERRYISVSSHPHWFSNYLLGSGWSVVGGEFVWSEGYNAHLLIPVDADFHGSLMLDLAAYLPVPTLSQRVMVTIDGVELSTISFSAAKNRQQVTFDIKPSNRRFVDVALNIDHPLSPKDFGSGDDRKLGIALYGLLIDRR